MLLKAYLVFKISFYFQLDRQEFAAYEPRSEDETVDITVSLHSATHHYHYSNVSDLP